MKRMKRAFRSRKDCGAAMLAELQRKFPAVEFKLSYFNDGYWTLDEIEQTYEKYKTSPALLRESASIEWTDGPGYPVVDKIAQKYMKTSWVLFDDTTVLKRIKNVGWDEQGNAVQMGLFHDIFTTRELTPEGRQRAETILLCSDSVTYQHCEPEDVSL